MAASSESKELDLVSNAQMKILAVSNNEKKLQNILNVYMCPLFLKAASPSAAVRSEVVKFASTMQTLIKPTSISLPVEGLIDQYKAQQTPLIRHIDFMFITLGLDRMDDYEKRQVVGKIIQGISSADKGGSSSSMLRILLRVIPAIQIPSRGTKESNELRDTIGLSDSADASWLATWLGKILLLKLPVLESGSNPNRDEILSRVKAVNKSLTPEELDFLSPDWRGTAWAAPYDELPTLRRKAAQLLASGAFTDREKLVPAIFAASSNDGQVASVGEEMLKRTSISFEDENLAKELFSAHERMAAPYRTRILGLLAKSTISTTMESEIERVVDMDLGQGSTDTLKATSGLEQQKLHRALLGYLSFVAMWGPSKGPFSIGNTLIDRILDFFTESGWPQPNVDLSGRDASASSQIELRGLAYEVLGLVAKATELTPRKAYELAAWLFQALSEDPTSDIVFHVESALSGLVRHLEITADSKATDEPLAKLLYNYIAPNINENTQAVRSIRFTAVKWANQCLPFRDWRGRWIDVLAIAGRKGESHDVVEEGKKGLDPWTYRVRNSGTPDWTKLLTTFFYGEIDADTYEDEPMTNAATTDVDYADQDIPLRNFTTGMIDAYPVALQFAKQMMYLAALPSLEMGPDWVSQLETALKNDLSIRSKIYAYIHDSDVQVYASLLLKACFDGATSPRVRSSDPTVEECLSSLVDLASFFPVSTLEPLASQTPKLQELLSSNNKQIRQLAAKAIGILGAQPANHQTLDEAVTEGSGPLSPLIEGMKERIPTWSSAFGSEANAVEGSLVAFGSLFSHSVFSGFLKQPSPMIPFAILESTESGSTLDAALDAWAQLWAARLSSAMPQNGTEFGSAAVIKALKAKAEAGNEKAITALGRLALASDDETKEPLDESANGLLKPEGTDDRIDDVLRSLYGLARKKETEIHFTIGEAIAASVACLDSEAVKLSLTVHEVQSAKISSPSRDHRLRLVLDKLFKDCKDTAPFRLKSSGIWLFCLIQYCGNLPEVRSRLREAQVAFMRLLSARDELVQETASRGLVLIYEKGDQELRSQLSQDLVSSFTDQSTKLKVEGDTELFEEGALPTGEGKSIKSYKDIVALANEVGDQSLVYKFMALANNAATWSTRSAFGRFGLGNILADSEIDPKVYPPLYRYRFDPNRNAQASMENVWKALVRDQNDVVSKHFDAIMSDLLKTILGKEWRVREASCAAISDLLGGQPFEKYAKYYQDIWTAALKVIDDVKGSVREAAMKLCMGLTSTIVRLLEDGNHSSAAKAMLKEALRFLLSPSGLESSVKEAQQFSLKTIMDITRKGGSTLRPFISSIIPHLLELHSTAEGEQVSYAYQKVAQDTRHKLDKLRASYVNSSPITEAVDNCLRQIDSESLKELAPKIESIIKSAIGMPTKIACGRLLTDLVLRHRNDFEPFATKFLRIMEKQCLDRNDEVSRAYAAASAYIIRVTPDAATQRFIKTFTDLYFDSEDEGQRRKVADVFAALSKSSPDEFNNMETRILPFVYLASFDTEPSVKKPFAAVWDDHAGSSRTVARFVPEVMAFVQRGLDAPRWALQHTSAFAVAAMIPALASASDTGKGQIGEANLKLIWPEFKRALALKTFEKKEKVLEAFPVFVDKGHALWKQDAAVAAEHKKIAIREAKRNNDAYRPHAFKSLWKFAKARDDVDMLDDIFAVVEAYLEDLQDEDKMDVDSDEDKATDTAAKGIEAVSRGYNRSKLKADPYDILAKVLNLLKPFLQKEKFFMAKKQVWYESVRDLMSEAAEASVDAARSAEDAQGVAMTYVLSLDLDHPGTENQRVARAQAMGAIFKAQMKGVFGPPPDKANMVQSIKQAMEAERSPDVQGQWKKILEELK